MRRFKSKEQFERRFKTRLINDSFAPGTLVLVRNTTIEKSMNRKPKNRYNGPYVVVKRTQGGSYILQEVDGATCRVGVAAFRIIPYIARDEKALQKLGKAKSLARIDEAESDNEAVQHTPRMEDEDDSDDESLP